MSVRLLITAPGEPPIVHALPTGVEMTVGRAAENALRLTHASVSNRHARLRLVPGGVEVLDDGSRWGTQIGGARVVAQRWSPVPPGATLWFGDVAAIVLGDGDDEATRAAELSAELHSARGVLSASAERAGAGGDDDALWSVAASAAELAPPAELDAGRQRPVHDVGADPADSPGTAPSAGPSSAPSAGPPSAPSAGPPRVTGAAPAALPGLGEAQPGGGPTTAAPAVPQRAKHAGNAALIGMAALIALGGAAAVVWLLF